MLFPQQPRPGIPFPQERPPMPGSMPGGMPMPPGMPMVSAAGLGWLAGILDSSAPRGTHHTD